MAFDKSPPWEPTAAPPDPGFSFDQTLARSPGPRGRLDHFAKWQKSLLVIHGALDFRVVDTQGMAAFTALQRRGIPSKLLHFPDENPWVLEPHDSSQWHDTVLAWLTEWTR